MTVLQLIVPCPVEMLHFLGECLHSIKNCTPVDHVVNVVVGRAHVEDRVGEAVGIARSVYDRSGLVITTAPPDAGYNGMAMEALRDSDFAYTAVLPVSHRIVDGSWFGKMQLPLIRAPGCGMTFAPDDQPASTNASFPASWKERIDSKFFMLSRAVLELAMLTPVDDSADDLANAVRDHLRTAATVCWSVPSCRIEQRHAEWL
jgi:hypothetical protein